jgi:AcrR family transcriptional regulator
MTSKERVASISSGDWPASWREQAVARSLDSARVRAEKRVQRFLDAASALMNGDSGTEFTVQDVVVQSGQSLRTFYHFFTGKHELLLSLFEESVQTTAERLRALIAEEGDPLGRLRRFTVEYHALCRRSAKTGSTPVLAKFAQQLLSERPDEASQAYVPLRVLAEQLLDDAEAADAIRPGLCHRHLAGVMIQTISFDAFSRTIGGTKSVDDADDAAELWDFLVLGLGARPGSRQL